jgi:hypothetical protein
MRLLDIDKSLDFFRPIWYYNLSINLAGGISDGGSTHD